MKNDEIIVIDLAEYAKAKKNPPKGAKYKFQVKNKVYEVDVESMAGREICEMAGLVPPENYKLDMKIHGGIYKEVTLEQVVSFLEPGIEKFTYISREQTEG